MAGPYQFQTFNDRRRAAGGFAVPVIESFRPMMEQFASGRGVAPGDLAGGLVEADHIGPAGNSILQREESLDRATEAALIKGLQLEEEENRRFAEQSEFLGDEFNRANAPTLSAADIERIFGSRADQAANDATAAMRNLRSGIGASGARGGQAAGLGAMIQLQRQGQLSGARRDLLTFKAEADRQDRIDRYGRAVGLATFRNQSPSMIGMDTLASNVDTALTRLGIVEGREAARDAANSAERAGIFGGVGGLIGGGLRLAAGGGL